MMRTSPSPSSIERAVPCRLPLRPVGSPRIANWETEWILPTSGTTGPPKLVRHTLRTLMGAIGDAPLQQWATFYDIRRYGGLQIFLRALSGRGSLILGAEGESVSSLLARFGDAKITHISGTPTHWRKVLISGEGLRIDPRICSAVGRDCGQRGISCFARALSARAYRARLRLDRSWRCLCGRATGRRGFPRLGSNPMAPSRRRLSTARSMSRSSRSARGFLGEGAAPR